jgi:addiction module HigA family antidote
MAKKELSAGGRRRLPVHPGEIIGGILKDCRVSQRTAATAMGVSHNALAHVIRGATGISPDMAVRLAVYMHQVGTSEEANLVERTEFWLRLQASFDAHEAATRLKDEVKKIKPCPRPEEQ